MAASEDLTLKMRTRGARAAAREVDRGTRSVKGLDKQTRRLTKTQRLATTTTGRLGSGLKSLTRGVATAAVGLGALAVGELVKATKGWSEHLAVVRRTNAVIRSTGEAANVTAKHVDSLSQKIEKQTGIDNDIIQAGANMLLTFTNIRNGVGKNNKIFDEATNVITGMSQAGFDMRGSAIQVGKALNDPIKGITALTRVGVTFSKGQKEQIENAVESGDRMKAQRIILKELRKEFPKVKATPWENLQRVFRDIEDSLGKAILPAVTRFVRRVTPAVEQFGKKFGGILDNKNLKWDEKLKAVGDLLKTQFGPMIASWHIPEKLGQAFSAAAPRALSAFWAGFKEMGPEGKAITAAAIATKLGLGPQLFGGVGKQSGKMFGGKFGKAAGAAGVVGLAATLDATKLSTAAKLGAVLMVMTSVGPEAGIALAAYLGISYLLEGKHKQKTVTVPGNRGLTGVLPPTRLPRQRQLQASGQPTNMIERNTKASQGYKGIPAPAPIHTHVHIDGKEVATAVHRASTRKKATR